MFNKLKSFWKWVRQQWKKLLIGLGIIGVALAIGFGGPLEELETSDIELNKIALDYSNTTSTFQEKYSRVGTDFVMKAKDRNATGIKIGNGTDKFSPDVEINKWEGLAKFKIKPRLATIDEKDKTFSIDDTKNKEKIKLQTPKMDINLYDLPPDEQNEDGGYEYEIVLKEKPQSNVISLDIENEGLDFYYQPALTQKEIDEGHIRPDNIVGSYAVYYKEQGDYSALGGYNFRAGKAFHIYRPKITDANGDWIWGEFNQDLQATGVLSITIKQDWLDKAVYPVIVDPTFGYTVKPATTDGVSCKSSIVFNKLTFSNDTGSGKKMVAYLKATAGSDAQAYLYNSSFQRVSNGSTTINTSMSATAQWVSFPFVASPTLTNGTYYFAIWSDTDCPITSWLDTYYDTGSGTRYIDDGISPTYRSWPSTLGRDSTSTAMILGNYVQYDCTGANSAQATNFSYYKQITIESGYSTGVATTTNRAYVIVASTTDANLAATSSGGHMVKVNAGDLAFFASDQTTPLDFELEYYNGTTGALVAWIRTTEGLSSTTDKTIYAYYGYSSGIGYQCVEETWGNATGTDPVGVWHMQNSTSTNTYQYDSTINHNDGTFVSTNASSQQRGHLDGSFDFDGVNDYVNMGTNSAFDFNTTGQTFTLETWVFPKGTTYDPNIQDVLFIAKDNGSGASLPIYAIGMDPVNGRIRVYYSSSLINSALYTVSHNTWTHLAAVFTIGDKVKVYKNGAYWFSVTVGAGSGVSGGALTLGAHKRTSSINGVFKGIIDNVRIYNRALTIADIQTMYNMERANSSFLTWGSEQSTTPPSGGPTQETEPQDIIQFN
jgi:hypothetical protein